MSAIEDLLEETNAQRRELEDKIAEGLAKRHAEDESLDDDEDNTEGLDRDLIRSVLEKAIQILKEE